MINVYDNEIDADELKKALAKKTAKHVWKDGDKTWVFTGEDIPKTEEQ